MEPFKHSKQLHWFRFFVVLIILISSYSNVFGQIERGKKYFQQEQYTEAIKPLRKEFYSKTRNIEAGILLAKCYYHLQKYDDANDVMAEISKAEISSRDDILFLADLDIANQNYSEAFLTIIQQLDKNEMDEKTLTWFYKISDIIKWDTIPNGSQVAQVKGINTVYNDFAPYIATNKELWFVSDALGIQMVFPAAYDNRNLNLFNKTTPYKQDATTVQKPSMLLRSRDYYYHDVAIVEWKNQDKYVVILRHLNDANERLGLYISDKTGKEKDLIPFKYNQEYNTGYATFDKTGNRMIFASDRPGGYGKMDLWYSDWKNGEWTEPINMGPIINSPYNEIYPAYTIGKLFFASDRPDMGYGALDLYYSSETLGFKKIKNLKSPINSPYDDFGITFSDEKNGYFTSNRITGVGGDDIMAFKYEPTSITIPNSYFEINDGVVAQNAIIKILNTSDSLITTIQNVKNNEFTIPNLATNQTYKLISNQEMGPQALLSLMSAHEKKKVNFTKDHDGAYYFEILAPEDWEEIEIYDNELYEEASSYSATILYDLPQYSKFVLKHNNGSIIDTLYTYNNSIVLPNLNTSLWYELQLIENQFDENREIEIFNTHNDLVYKGMSRNKNTFIFSLLDNFDNSLARMNNNDQSNLIYDLASTQNKGAVNNNPIVLDVSGLKNSKGYIEIKPNQEYIFKNNHTPHTETIAIKIPSQTKLNIYNAKNEVLTSFVAHDSNSLLIPNFARNESIRIISLPIHTGYQNYSAKIVDFDLPDKTPFLLSQDLGLTIDTVIADINGNLSFQKLRENIVYNLDLMNTIFDENKNIQIFNKNGVMVFDGNSTNKKKFTFSLLNQHDNLISKLSNEDDSFLHFNMGSNLNSKNGGTTNTSNDIFYKKSNNTYVINISEGGKYKIHSDDKSGSLAVNIPENTELTIYNKKEEVVLFVESAAEHEFVFAELDNNETYTLIVNSTQDELVQHITETSSTETKIEQNSNTSDGNNYLPRIDHDSKESTSDYKAQIIKGSIKIGTAFVLRESTGVVIDTIFAESGNTLNIDHLKKNIKYELEILQTTLPYNHEIIILNQYDEEVYRGISKSLKLFEFIIFDIEDRTLTKLHNEDKSLLKLNFVGRIESRSAKPITISMYDASGRFLAETTSTLKGDFKLSDIPESHEYILNTDVGNPDDHIVLVLPHKTDSIYLKRRKEGDFYIAYHDIREHEKPDFEKEDGIAQKTGSKFSIPNVYYGFDSYALTDEGKKSIDKVIELLKNNPELRIELQSHTDRRGRSDYNLWLSQQRANSVVKYIVNAGIHKSRLVAVGKGETEPIHSCPPQVRCTEKEHAENRRTEFMVLAPVEPTEEHLDLDHSNIADGTTTTPTKFVLPNIYYNFDSHILRQESKKSLDSLIAILEANPELRIEVQSHTDIRGSEKYNILLSRRRANAVVEYMARAGIERSRLFAVGKGDKELLNHCTTAAACSEEQHAVNRKTEFVILSATAQL